MKPLLGLLGAHFLKTSFKLFQLNMAKWIHFIEQNYSIETAVDNNSKQFDITLDAVISIWTQSIYEGYHVSATLFDTNKASPSSFCFSMAPTFYYYKPLRSVSEYCRLYVGHLFIWCGVARSQLINGQVL